MTEFEIGKMVAGFVTENISSIVDMGSKVFKDAGREIKVRLELSYKAYLEETSYKYSHTKSFFIRNTPVGLYDFYVPISVSSGRETLDNPTFYSLSRISRRIVILGTGGCGKSVLMKHLFLGCISTKEQVPVFVELRELNSSKINLLDMVANALNSEAYSFDEKYIDKAIEQGHFAFILDGYDEVSNNLRKKLISDIKALSRKGKQCSIIISSRPDEVFAGIDEFDIYQVQNLSLDAACSLVEKLPFDKDVKGNFIAELRGGMYEKHESFLSNPLLLSIMLLTYGQNAEIPTKLSIFYNQAYEALFQRHDALKGGYKRERCTNLDIQDFAKVFSVFSLQTYDKRLFGLSRMDALNYIEKSKRHLSKLFDSEAYLEDSLKATCLLVEDGLKIVFSHRSFQEYFVAFFINNASPEIQNKLISKYWKNMRSDNVILLLHEMNPGLVERLLIIPVLKDLFHKIGVEKTVGITHFDKYLKLIYSSINIEEEIISATLKSNDADISDVMHFAIRAHQTYKIPKNVSIKVESRGLMRKHGDPEGKKEYKTKDLSYRNPLVRDLAVRNGVFSVRYLAAGFEVMNELQSKHRNIENTLDELLDV